MSKLSNKPLREKKKSKFGIADSVCISMYGLPFRKGVKPQFTQEVFKIVTIDTKKTSNVYNQRRTRRNHTWEIL